jgi:hypothetical protein
MSLSKLKFPLRLPVELYSVTEILSSDELYVGTAQLGTSFGRRTVFIKMKPKSSYPSDLLPRLQLYRDRYIVFDKHPGIARNHNVFPYQDQLISIDDYYPMSLRDLPSHRKIFDVSDIIHQVIDVAVYLHDNKFIHGGLDLDNCRLVYVGKRLCVKVCGLHHVRGFRNLDDAQATILRNTDVSAIADILDWLLSNLSVAAIGWKATLLNELSRELRSQVASDLYELPQYQHFPTGWDENRMQGMIDLAANAVHDKLPDLEEVLNDFTRHEYNDWPDLLHHDIQHFAYNHSMTERVDRHEFTSLLRVERNKAAHYEAIGGPSRLVVKHPPLYVRYWVKTYKKMIVHLWKAISTCNKPHIVKYFEFYLGVAPLNNE